jgi:glucokinase
MKTESYSIGIDIGGTKVSIGIVDRDGQVVDSINIKTDTNSTCKENIKHICMRVKKLLDENDISLLNQIIAVGIGVPGTVDVKNGVVIFCTNLSWRNEPIKNYCIEYLGRDIILVQDIYAGAVAEKLLGHGKNLRNFVFIALGTGIACGLIINGKLYMGGLGTAGELGEMVMVPDGLPCPCGHRGCLERYFSGAGIQDFAKQRYNKELSALDVFDLARNGDKIAKKIIKDGVNILAVGIAHVASILSPEAIVISGGMCKELELVINPLQILVNKYSYKLWSEKNPNSIIVSKLGREAPMIGAGLIYKEFQEDFSLGIRSNLG